MYSKILLAYDGTEHGVHALTAAQDLAERYHASLIILTVIEDLPRYAEGTMDSVDEYVERATTYLQKIHQTAEAQLQEAGVPVRSFIMPGNLVETVVHLAAREKADLIVLGGLGRSRLFRSRTGVQIYFHTPCPLMIVH